MATITDYNIDQGTDWSVVVTAKDDAGTAIDISNYTLSSQMRKNYTSTASHTLTATTLVGPSGTITLGLASAVSALIKSGYYYYDVEIASGGIVTRILEGKIHLRPEVTK